MALRLELTEPQPTLNSYFVAHAGTWGSFTDIVTETNYTSLSLQMTGYNNSTNAISISGSYSIDAVPFTHTEGTTDYIVIPVTYQEVEPVTTSQEELMVIRTDSACLELLVKMELQDLKEPVVRLVPLEVQELKEHRRYRLNRFYRGHWINRRYWRNGYQGATGAQV